jgi:hypothetical protein
MNHVRPGSLALKSRQQAAMERLEKHLKDHPKSHKAAAVAEGHDKSQRAELVRLKELCV